MAQRQRLPRPILISLPRRRMVSPAVAVAATRSASDSILRCRKGEQFRLQNAITLTAAAAKNGPPAAQSWGAGRDRVPRRRHNPK